VCDLPWSKSVLNSAGKRVDLTPQNIRSRVEEFSISLKTGKGKVRVSRTTPGPLKVLNNDNFAGLPDQIERLRKVYPKHQKLLADMQSPNRRVALEAAVKMNCITCSNGQLDLVKTCFVKDCVFYHISPLVKGKEDDRTEEEL